MLAATYGNDAPAGVAALSFDITLVVERNARNPVPDDLLLLREVEMLGLRARMCRWDDREVDWSASSITVLRSCWDYFHDLRAFHDWLSRASGETEFVNAVGLARWNSDKSYLFDLERAGVPIVPTIRLGADAQSAADEISMHGWRGVAIKPTAGCGGHGVVVIRDADPGAVAAHLRKLVDGGDILLQEFQPSVESERERSLVFIAGEFVHAFTKPPFDEGGGGDAKRFVPHEPSSGEMAVAEAALAASPAAPDYGRVDLVPSRAGPLVMELELIEPDLLLRANPATLRRLAHHLATRVTIGSKR